MDQIKIGRFIAATRKEQNFTQRQLAEKLNISDKTVSKWECGNGLPEVSLMLPLCDALKINVNELLSGERLSDDNYHEKAEENVMDLIREKEESKKKIILSAMVAGLTIIAALPMFIISGILEMETWLRFLLIEIGLFVIIIGIIIACILDRDAGTFECSKCGTSFTPDMKSYIMGAHTITKRHLKCPHCGESSYCKHRLSK